MKFLTSIGFSRIEHQKVCVASWMKVGASVTAVQSSGESERLREQFPNVHFVETDLVGDIFGKPHLPRIAAFFPEVTEPCFLINSDIQVMVDKPRFDRLFSVHPNSLLCGVRWDMHPRTRLTRPIRYGIDAFVLTPEIVSQIPDIGMTIGIPVWDYWLPYFCVTMLGLNIRTVKEYALRHTVHKQNWSDFEFNKGFEIAESYFGISRDAMTDWILRHTGRTGFRHPVWNI